MASIVFLVDPEARSKMMRCIIPLHKRSADGRIVGPRSRRASKGLGHRDRKLLKFAFSLVIGYFANQSLHTRLADAQGLHGDAELLRLAAVEHQANRERLRTWSATVAIEHGVGSGDQLS